MTDVVYKNYTSAGLSATICFGDLGLLGRLKMLYFLIIGSTVTLNGPFVRQVSAKEIKEVEAVP